MGAQKIDTTENAEYLLIQLPDLGNKDIARDLEVESKNWLLNDKKIHVFDFKKVTRFDQTFVVLFLNHFKSLKLQEKKVHSINMNTVMQSEFKDRSILNSFAPIAKIEDALPKKNGHKLDVAFLKHFIDGASKAFDVQVNLKIVPEKIFIKDTLFDVSDSVVGRVTIKSAKFSGQISLCLTKDVFFKIYFSLIGENITEIDKDTADAAGELMNIIYGHAKTALNSQLGFELKPIIPEILVSPMPEKLGSPVIVVPFKTASGSLKIEINTL